MLKFNYAVNLAVACVLVVPAVTLQSGQSRGLEQALGETVRALECLTGIESQAKSGSTPPYSLLRQTTEAPLKDAQARDHLLVSLRDDVNRLQMIYDVMQSKPIAQLAAQGALQNGLVQPDEERVHAAGDAHMPRITTGLDDGTRALLAGAQPDGDQASATSALHAPTTGVALEAEGFSADPLRHGQACYRAGRYTDALRLFEAVSGDVRATYWSGRTLEALKRVDEAIERYRKVSEDPSAGYLARRAASDLEFIEWKRAHTDNAMLASDSLPPQIKTPATSAKEHQ